MTTIPFAVDVFFQGQAVPGYGPKTKLPTPSTLVLSEREFKHSVLTMEFWGGDVESGALATGTPIQVNFGRPPQMRIFYGYVNHAGRTNNALASEAVDRNSITLYCVGASWPLKQRDVASFRNSTSTQIIQQIAYQYGLGSTVPVPSNRTTPQTNSKT